MKSNRPDNLAFSSTGYSGSRSSPIRPNAYNAYTPYNQYSPNNTYSASNEAPGYEPYTGGLSEEEQYQAAIRASLNDQVLGLSITDDVSLYLLIVLRIPPLENQVIRAISLNVFPPLQVKVVIIAESTSGGFE
ncbi:UNVERIFIED_CONTAM: hypothetical protein FKN15_043290 [Acipenser sinensis]